MCMIDDGEGLSHFSNDQLRTARREHKCKECWRTIAKGEKYFATSGVGDDGFFSSKTCRHCRVAQEWLMKECRGFYYGAVEEDIQEHISEKSHKTPLSLAKIAVGIKRKWKRFYSDALMAEPKMPSAIPHEN